MKLIYKKAYTPKDTGKIVKWKTIPVPSKIFEVGKIYEIRVFELK